MAAYFAPAGVFRLVDRDGGGVLDDASGREAVASLCRRLHENIEILEATTMNLRWWTGGIRYDWTARVRNWGFGAERATYGQCRIKLVGLSIKVGELALDPNLYFDLVNPDAPRGRRLALSEPSQRQDMSGGV